MRREEKRGTIGRREFMEGAVLSSAALLTPQVAIAAQSFAPAPAKFAAFHSLSPGRVEPQGGLGGYRQKQARQLTGNLPKVCWPFTKAFWGGNEDTGGHDWWGWEQKGYWIDGALRCALLLKDSSLLKQAVRPIHYTLDHVAPNGYLGPALLKDVEDRWPHTVFFRALAAQGEATGDLRIAAALRRHYLAERQREEIFSWPKSRNITNVEGLLWTYQQTQDSALLDMAKKAWDTFIQSVTPAISETSDLSSERVFAQTRIRAHGVSYAEISKLPTILYLHTGDKKYLRYAEAAQERMFTHHMLIDGLPSAAEEFSDVDPLRAHETCHIADMTWNWGYLLMATGDGKWGDRIERAIFNAGFGAIRKDWKGVQYFSSPNQVIATQNSSNVPYGYGGLSLGWMAYRPSPGHAVACCAGNVHRFLPNYAIRMWMEDGKGGVAAVLYGPSTVHAEVGSGRQTVEIQQETDYPFGEQIRFTIKAKQPVSFPLSLRIPAWCETPRLMLNGVLLDMPTIERGFVRIERSFNPGDSLTLELPMHTAVSFWPGAWRQDAVGLEHGPLVYALPVKEKWTSEVVPEWSTADFPEWDARPASEWNYGTAVSEEQIAVQARIERRAMTDDPWIDPPVTLTLPMRQVPGWTLNADSNHPERKQTPPLPDVGKSFVSAGASFKDLPPPDKVALIPFGCTHLRLSVFPQIGS